MTIVNGISGYSAQQAEAYKSANAEFPLRWHPKGGWCKKICGKVYYFGRVFPEQAHERYVHERDYLERGELPPAYDPNARTLQRIPGGERDANRKRRTRRSVEQAIAVCIPSEYGNRHDCIFKLARWLKKLMPGASLAELRPLVKQWVQAGPPLHPNEGHCRVPGVSHHERPGNPCKPFAEAKNIRSGSPPTSPARISNSFDELKQSDAARVVSHRRDCDVLWQLGHGALRRSEPKWALAKFTASGLVFRFCATVQVSKADRSRRIHNRCPHQGCCSRSILEASSPNPQLRFDPCDH